MYNGDGCSFGVCGGGNNEKIKKNEHTEAQPKNEDADDDFSPSFPSSPLFGPPPPFNPPPSFDVPSASYSPSQLPNGWSERVDAKTGRSYYVHLYDKIVQKERPTFPALPDGWERRFDAGTGNFYYADTTDQTTSWYLPREISVTSSGPEMTAKAVDGQNKSLSFLPKIQEKPAKPKPFKDFSVTEASNFLKAFAKNETQTALPVSLVNIHALVNVSNKFYTFTKSREKANLVCDVLAKILKDNNKITGKDISTISFIFAYIPSDYFEEEKFACLVVKCLSQLDLSEPFDGLSRINSLLGNVEKCKSIDGKSGVQVAAEMAYDIACQCPFFGIAPEDGETLLEFVEKGQFKDGVSGAQKVEEFQKKILQEISDKGLISEKYIHLLPLLREKSPQKVADLAAIEIKKVLDDCGDEGFIDLEFVHELLLCVKGGKEGIKQMVEYVGAVFDQILQKKLEFDFDGICEILSSLKDDVPRKVAEWTRTFIFRSHGFFNFFWV